MVETIPSTFWANATIDSDLITMYDNDTCQVHHDPVALYLSIFLCAGLIVSYLPQIFRIILKKSSQGFSPWFLLLGATSSASSFLNVVALQWGIVRCCSALSGGECAESLLGIAQVFLQWFMFIVVFVLFLVYYPLEMKYERAIALPPSVEDQLVRNRARKAAKQVAAARSSASHTLEGHLAAPSANTKKAPETFTDDASSASDNSDLDSVDSHIAQNYSSFSQPGRAAPADSSDDEEEEQDASNLSVPQGGHAYPREASSSAFSRLAPAFWPMWKAPGGMQAIEEGRATEASQESNQGLLTGAPRAIRRMESERRAKLLSRKGLITRKRKTEEWSLAVALAWVVLIHFVFIVSITLLLVTSLPDKSFPPPEEMVTFRKASKAFGPSSRLLVSRWAAFLGTAATVLAAGQYLPQIVYTARTQLVGSLSIPMMCLQVPGSAVFVYSLALQPGTDWSSLAAYVITGVLQLVLLILCITWRIRQHRSGIDDFGRPIFMIAI